jgi:hypothetical protein
MSGITAGHDGRLVGKITGAKPSAIAFPIYSVCRFLSATYFQLKRRRAQVAWMVSKRTEFGNMLSRGRDLRSALEMIMGG